jgi:hypothetical protein
MIVMLRAGFLLNMHDEMSWASTECVDEALFCEYDVGNFPWTVCKTPFLHPLTGQINRCVVQLSADHTDNLIAYLMR